MKFNFDKHKPLCRIFICLVCALTIFGLFCRPITANASGTAVITWGLTNGLTMAVLPEIALIGGLLICAGYIVDNLDDFYYDCQQLYNNPYVQKWAYTYAGAGDITSLSQVYYDQETALAVNEYVGTMQLPGLPPNNDDGRKYYMVLPATFMALDTLQSTSMLLYDKATMAAVLDNKALILQGNALAVETNAAIIGLQGSITEIAITVGTAAAALSVLETQIKDNLPKLVPALTTINTSVNDMKSSLAYRLDDVKMAVANTRTALQTSIQDQTSSLAYRMDLIPTTMNSLWNKKVTPLAPVFRSYFVDLQLWENSVNNDTEDGRKSIPIWLDRGKNTITFYAAPLLATSSVLGMFFDIPIISDLLYFSLSLGIFALIVNLGNTVVSRSSSDATKGSKSKVGNRG